MTECLFRNCKKTTIENEGVCEDCLSALQEIGLMRRPRNCCQKSTEELKQQCVEMVERAIAETKAEWERRIDNQIKHIETQQDTHIYTNKCPECKLLGCLHRNVRFGELKALKSLKEKVKEE